jgi:hypothetical protein
MGWSEKHPSLPPDPRPLPSPATTMTTTTTTITAPPPLAALASTSSEDETEDDGDEDGSWVSDDASVEQANASAQPHIPQPGKVTNNKGGDKEDVRLCEAALEAQRQRKIFAKVLKRAYSNINRTQSVVAVQMAKISAQVVANSTTNTRRAKGRPREQEMEEERGGDTSKGGAGGGGSQGVANLAKRGTGKASRASKTTTGATPANCGPCTHCTHSATAAAETGFDDGSDGSDSIHPSLSPPCAGTAFHAMDHSSTKSLRRNLLWTRQVCKTSMMGGNTVGDGRRRQSAGAGGLRPLTTLENEDMKAVDESERRRGYLP